MKKLILIFIIFLTGFIVALFLFKDVVAKSFIETALARFVGMRTKVGAISVDLPHTAVTFKRVIIYNPKGFKSRVFGDAPEIYIAIDLRALLKKEAIHLKEVRLNIRRLNLEKNGKGIYNVEYLGGGRKDDENTQTSQTPAAEKPSSSVSPVPSAKKPMPFKLDRLELTVNNVSYQNQTSFFTGKVTVDLKIEDEVFENIEDPKFILEVIFKKMTEVGLKQIPMKELGDLGLMPEGLNKALADPAGFGLNVFSKVATTTTKESTTGLIKVEETTAANVTNVTNKLKKIKFKDLLGALSSVSEQSSSSSEQKSQ
jgi:hypothetical protein